MEATYSGTASNVPDVTVKSLLEAMAKIPPMPVCPAWMIRGDLIRAQLTVEQRCRLRLYHYDQFGADYYVTETHPLHPDNIMKFFVSPFKEAQ